MASSSSIKKKKVGINDVEVELVAVNDPSIITADLGDKFTSDAVQGPGMRREVKIKDKNTILIGDKDVRVFGMKNGEEIPWKEAGADYIVETDGVFTDDKDGAAVNLNAVKMVPVGSLPVTKRFFKMRKPKLNWKKLDKFKKTSVTRPEPTRNLEKKLHHKDPTGNEKIFIRKKAAATKRMRDELGEMGTAIENEYKRLKKTHELAVAEMEIESEMERALMPFIFPPPAPPSDDDEEED